MKKLLSILFVFGALYMSYYFLKEIDWEGKPEIVNTITHNVQQTVEDTSDKLKKELDRIQLEQAMNTELTMEKSEVEETHRSDKLSTKEPEEIISFLAEQLDVRSPSTTFHIYGSYDSISNGLKEWLEAAFVENEYARYALASYSYSVTNKLLYTEVELKTVFRESSEMTAQVRKYAKELIATMNLGQYDQAEQIKLIHDWIVTNVQYDQSLTRYTAYEAITEGLAVCQGYAMLADVLYSEAGFDIRIVEGKGKGEEHAWNMILLDDKWYHLDLTWDDPVGQAEDEVSYRYYLVSDEELSADHSWAGNYPKATTSYKEVLNKQLAKLAPTSDEYKKVSATRQQLGLHWNDKSVTVDSYEALQDRLRSQVNARENHIQFRYIQGNHVEDDVDKALRSLKVGMSYEMSYYEYSKQGDVIVTLMIKY